MTILQTQRPLKSLNQDTLRTRYPGGEGGVIYEQQPSLLHHHQHIPRPNRIPHNHPNPSHPPRLGRLQLILHLHRLNHHATLPLLHLIPNRHQQPHHPPRHGSLHRPRPLRPRSRPTPALQRPRILHLKTIPPSINHHPIPIKHTPVLPPLRLCGPLPLQGV